VRVEYGDPADALVRLAAGELDAVIEVTSAPWQQLQETLRTTPLRLVGLDPEQAAAVQTVAATALLVAHSDVADATVEAVLEYRYAAAADRGGVLAARLSKERARTGITIPMHPGAQRFFARAGDRPVTSGNP
jgi:TRAP-type uncharacterized transport system substrate-binding protein